MTGKTPNQATTCQAADLRSCELMIVNLRIQGYKMLGDGDALGKSFCRLNVGHDSPYVWSTNESTPCMLPSMLVLIIDIPEHGSLQ